MLSPLLCVSILQMSCAERACDLDSKNAQQMDQRPLDEHVVLEEVQLEVDLGLGPLLFCRPSVRCGVVPNSEEGYLPLQTAGNLSVS